jgi:hypothetical protein
MVKINENNSGRFEIKGLGDDVIVEQKSVPSSRQAVCIQFGNAEKQFNVWFNTEGLKNFASRNKINISTIFDSQANQAFIDNAIKNSKK